jgi:hypothetical protein
MRRSKSKKQKKKRNTKRTQRRRKGGSYVIDITNKSVDTIPVTDDVVVATNQGTMSMKEFQSWAEKGEFMDQ